jgi:hypothetical protein
MMYSEIDFKVEPIFCNPGPLVLDPLETVFDEIFGIRIIASPIVPDEEAWFVSGYYGA